MGIAVQLFGPAPGIAAPRPAGISGSGATAGWFIAFALASVAEVRAVGQVELIFSILVSMLIFKEKINKTEFFRIILLAASILIVIFARI